MNVTDQALRAYAPAQMPVHTPRSLESRLFSQVTGRLRQASQNPNDFPKLAQALHDNRRMWTALATDVADADNKLPKQLRAQIFYLAEFTEKHTRDVLNGLADVTALLDVNTAIMRGLNAKESG